ncbi:MAG: hypothetical protein SCALA702_26550 [Melioribacteraceae bacterium]|nr:MAG: hypothetical protein SCALA702_26550 [Melioribacteraceae bacterium]
MSYDILSTSYINNMVSNYSYMEYENKIAPLKTRQDKYQRISDGYSTLDGKLESLKDLLEDLKETGSSSIFANKATSTTDSKFVTATASSSAITSNYNFRINSLARNDIAISSDLDSDTANAITGTHTFQIKSGDGEGGEFVSNIEVEFEADETNETMLEKIANAINNDKGYVTSSAMDATSTFTGSGSFVIDMNGEETTIDYDYSSGATYEEVIDDLVAQISDDVDGVIAEKVVDGSNVSLKLKVDDNNDYITIDQTTDTGSLLGSGELNLNAIKEKSAAGTVSASAFAPTTATSQLSITAKNTGVDYRISSLLDTGSSTALTEVGLNLGAARPDYDQAQDPDTPGFMYSDITDANNELNARFSMNNIDIQRSSNIISDLVNGVTFTMNAAMDTEDSDVSVTVNNDIEGSKSKIEDFVSKFNDVYKYIKNNSQNMSGYRGIFLGDSNASSLLSNFRITAYSQVDGITSGNIDDLNEIGLEFDSLSGLKIADSNTLEKKLSENISQVEKLFNSSNGIANQLYDAIDPYLGSDGYIESLKSSYGRNIKSIKDKITSTQTRIDDSSDTLRGKYEDLQLQLMNFYSMQSMMSSLSSSGFYY